MLALFPYTKHPNKAGIMSPNAPDPTPRKAGGLWARLFGVQNDAPPEPDEKQQCAQESESAEPASSSSLTEQQQPPRAQRVDQSSSAVPEDAEPAGDDQTGGKLPDEVESVFETQTEPSGLPFAEVNLDGPPGQGYVSTELGDEDEELLKAQSPTELDSEDGIAEPMSGPLNEPIPEVPQLPEGLLSSNSTLAEMPEVVTGPISDEYTLEIPPTEPPVEAEPPAQPLLKCPACSAIVSEPTFCPECGYMFTGNERTSAVTPAVGVPEEATAATSHVAPQVPLQDRYQVGELISQRGGLYYYRGTDLMDPSGTPAPVLILAGPTTTSQPSLPVAEVEPVDQNVEDGFEDFLADFDDGPLGELIEDGVNWPSISWEKAIRDNADHPSIPQVLDQFVEGDFEYLIVETVSGPILWDAWSDPETTYAMRYGWLIQIAAGLRAIHQSGAILEALQPDKVTVNESGHAVLSDLTDLLPIPVPANAQIRGSLYTAPELMISPETATAQADMYSFGAMLYALEYLGHHLQESDFEHQFSPKLITDRYPDVHPAFNRLILKTFNRDQFMRFPTDEASKTDPTGFTELIRTLSVCQKTFDRVRLDIAAWTTTGMIRTGNEDAFALLHASESREDELTEYALVLLADGMGGYDAGEVAAAMALKELRAKLLEHPIFSAVAGKEPPPDGTFDLDTCKELLKEALRHANKTVYTASRTPGEGKRGMGCTAEAIYVDDQNVVVGHVGDSRTYHLTNGQLVQLTRDHTWVNRMVELGKLTPEEAETHDRKNELQQAIGGQPDVTPEMYQAKLNRGDWLLVCSDGLNDKVPDADIVKMLTRETSGSAEDAAKRLLNLVNLRGATDNTTVVVIRAS